MKKLLTLLLALPLAWGHATAQENAKYTILLTGASFADTANRMAEGTLWNAGELDEMDALVIMQVHNRDVSATGGLKEKYTDYTTPFDRSNYAAAFDYVIKRYQSECYALKDDPKSKYYGTKSGKPAVIVLCTDWHDARTTYNAAIRRLAARWGLPLVEFDRNIGFSKDTPNPATGTQQSLLHAQDTQTIEGVAYGWHPQRGQDKYIQQRMAAIFTDTMRRILPAK